MTTKVRSPNYPAMSLGEAIEKVDAIYKVGHRRKMSREEIVKLLGYTGLNGASITLISTLFKYGLLEGRGDEVRVSDDAIAIVIDTPGAPERVAALRRAALRPELFAELAASFADGPLPGDNAIRIRLEKLGFTAKAASVAARSFRDTAALVTAEGGAYNVPEVAESEGDQGGSMQPQAPIISQAPVPPSGSRPSTHSSSAASPHSQGLLLLQVPFKQSTLSVRIDTGGEPLTSAHVARVRKYLELAEMDLGEEGNE